ncbi:MAG TPA: hypothetical protein VFX17_00390 [Patescibacteria group bacterium]|nr:hypothetical protein [Patescibacteria group bacterium]
MQNKNPVWQSLGHAFLVLVYVSIVAFIMSHGDQWFGQQDTGWTPIAILMLFVVSAAVTASLVLGRPALMYLDGRKKEALQFFGYTIGWLAVLTIIVFIVMAAVR